MTTPTVVAVETGPIVFSTQFSKTTTTAAESGDVIALVHFAQFDGGVGMVEPTSPSGGWTERRFASEPTWEPAIKLWTRQAPVGTFTVTIPAPAAGHQGVIFILRNAVEAPEATAESFGDSQAGHVTPSVNASTSDALILRAIATRGGDSGAYTWPSSTERTDTAGGSGSGGGVFSTATRVASASGAQGTETLTGTAVSAWGEYIGLTAAFGGSAAVTYVRPTILVSQAAVNRASRW